MSTSSGRMGRLLVLASVATTGLVFLTTRLGQGQEGQAQLGRSAKTAVSESPSLPPEKAEVWGPSQPGGAGAKRAQKPANPGLLPTPTSSPLSDSDWPTGIFDDGEFPDSEYRFVNRWTGLMGDDHISVYAGAYTNDSGQGVVLVKIASLDLTDVTVSVYATPSRSGSVRIDAVDGLEVTLSSVEGATFVFDAETGTWK